MWMNEAEIDNAKQRIVEDQCAPHLVEAVQFLSNFRGLINEISDGWAYWSYGTTCSGDLQDLVNLAYFPARRVEVSEGAVQVACEKVRRFLRKCDQTKNNPKVQAFLNPAPAQSSPPAPPVRQPDVLKSFRVVSASSNLNGFGLRGYVLVARDGEAWQVGRSDDVNRCVAPEFKKGADITVRVRSDGPEFPACEIPERLPDCPAGALRELYGDQQAA